MHWFLWNSNFAPVTIILTTKNDYRYENEFTLDVHMVVGEKFKIVVNHEWGQRGGYGYHDIDGIDMLFKALQPEGEEDNVLVTASCHIVLRAMIDGEFIHLVLTEGELEVEG